MLKNIIYRKLTDYLGYPATRSQDELLTILSEFVSAEHDPGILLVKGFAGTGKTTSVNALVKYLDETRRPFILLAPTGRAAKVLTSYTGKVSYTIHKKIYRQKSGRDGTGNFVLDYNPHKEAIFIVDEASMIGSRSQDESVFGSGDLLSDLFEYIRNGRNCRLILLGDTAQLPPVGQELSRALEPSYLEGYGPGVIEVELTDVVRQASESGILLNATRIRETIGGRDPFRLNFITLGFPDVYRIDGTELVNEIENSYNQAGEDETIIITRSNKRANRYNQGIRNQILWREDEIALNDLMMIVKNNYYWAREEKSMDFIANGDIAILKAIRKYYSLYNLRFADVSLEFPDYENIQLDTRILLDTLGMETPSMTRKEQKDFYDLIMEDYHEVQPHKKRVQKVLDDPYFNAIQIKFGYAVTCHKAQGGQWKNVFIDPGFFRDEMLERDYLRWMYTAVTRATERLYLVNFPEAFF